MEFILEQQAKNQAMLANLLTAHTEAARRNDVAERRLDHLESLLARMGRLGVKSRTRIHHRLEQHDQWFAHQQTILDRVDTHLAEATEKLNALIDVVDRWPKHPAA